MYIWYFVFVFLVIFMVGNSVLWVRGDIKMLSIIMVIGGGINVVFDLIFIFGVGLILEMGIGGVVLFMLIFWIICLIWILYLLVK